MLNLSQAVLPGMRARRAGTIVNIGSIAGRFITPGAGAYHISKYGVTALSLALRAEVRPFGVRVVLIEPTGVRDTKFFEARIGAPRPDAGDDPYADDDPYAEFKRGYDEDHRALTEMPGVMVTPTPSLARSSGRSKPTIPNPAISSGRLERPPCSPDCS